MSPEKEMKIFFRQMSEKWFDHLIATLKAHQVLLKSLNTANEELEGIL